LPKPLRIARHPNTMKLAQRAAGIWGRGPTRGCRELRTIPIYQIDAFTTTPFHGNPAAVCPLEKWLDDEVMQAVAMENNLSETAFTVPQASGGYKLRWFTPTTEVDLCGHATLATASLILERLEPQLEEVAFETLSGRLLVRKGVNGKLTMDFPIWPVGAACAPPEELVKAMGATPRAAFQVPEQHGAPYYLFEYATAAEVLNLAPATDSMKANVVATAAVDATAPKDLADADFVCRFFGPMSGVPEDPVTGSAHCTLAPFWEERLGKQKLKSVQVSARRGELLLELSSTGRVFISGSCAFFLEGKVTLPE